MIKKILALIEKIKCKMSCCYESKCSLNDELNINDNDIDEDAEELADTHSGF